MYSFRGSSRDVPAATNTSPNMVPSSRNSRRAFRVASGSENTGARNHLSPPSLTERRVGEFAGALMGPRGRDQAGAVPERERSPDKPAKVHISVQAGSIDVT